MTGRTHQLRVHAAHEKGLGCPIVGDSLNNYEQSQNPEAEENNDRQDDLNEEITYSIQMGAYRMLKYAQDMMNSLNENGYAQG